MNKKALGFALAAGLLGFALLFVYQRRFERRVMGGAPVAVVIATEDVPLGEALTAKKLGVRLLPEAYVEDRHIRASDVEHILDVRVSMRLKANEAVLWSDLATTTRDRRNLSGLVQNGMRAVTIRADVTSAFGGLLRPGDRVDVLYSTETRQEGPPSSTIPLLQNVLVLAVGSDTGNAAGEPPAGKPKLGSVSLMNITVAATVEQAQVLTYGVGHGRLSLTLRNPDDISVVRDLPETTMSDLMEPSRRDRVQRRVPAGVHADIERVR